MARSKTSKQWLKEHFDDFFVKKAQKEGYRSRAVYKLQEVDEKVGLIKPGMSVVDLGAAPGGWSQYAAKKMNGKGMIVALDLLPIQPISFVEILQGDFRETDVIERLQSMIGNQKVDLVMSDMAPNQSGAEVIDIPRAMYLAELALDFSEVMLKPGGSLFMKLFHGCGFDELCKYVRTNFLKVSIKKPKASRARSRETYLLAEGYNL